MRLSPAPAVLVDFVAQYNATNGTFAIPCAATAPADFVDDLQCAIHELPVAVTEKVKPHLIGIFFMQGIGASAITNVIAQANGEVIGSFVAIDIDAFLVRNANDWATWKENTPFTPVHDIRLELWIAHPVDNNRKLALQFLLLHEFGHVLTAGNTIIPGWWLDASQIKASTDLGFLSLSWKVNDDGQVLALASEDFSLRQQIAYYVEPKLSGADIPAVYAELEKTTFPSLYASNNVYEDFAECFATYVHCVMLGKRHEVNIFKAGELVLCSCDYWSTLRSRKKAAFLETFFSTEPTPRTPNPVWTQFSTQILPGGLGTPFLGLAPFLRMSINDGNLYQLAQGMLGKAYQELDNANLWMNLATAFFSLSQRDLGLAIQRQALQMKNIYHLPATRQPEKFRLLMVMAAGDLAENTPLDCLLEDSSISLTCYYATVAEPLPSPQPEHDALMVAMSDTRDTRPILAALNHLLRNWERPVINAPQNIHNTERNTASAILQNAPGLMMPLTYQIQRETLQAVATGAMRLHETHPDCVFPIILRPVGSHAGRDLDKINNAKDIGYYLERVPDAALYLSRFVDYSCQDGLFRKFRVALIAGRAYACHLAISAHWMIHYVNAGMYDDAGKRAEEANFMAHFATFAEKHSEALSAIHLRSRLDYVFIDCAETRDGELLIFEIDHAMVVHAMDTPDKFPYKQAPMLQVKAAFESFLFSLTGAPPTSDY